MGRVVIGFLVGLFMLGALALPLLMASGEAAEGGLTGAVRSHILDLSGEGAGFQDGRLVFSSRSPERITIEQLPTLEGRLRGTHRSSGMIADELIWYGISVREAIARCLDISPRLVQGDESLDEVWLDVDAARPRGLFEARFDDWSEVEEAILVGLETAYDLRVRVESGMRDVTVLRAGPGWPEHVHGGSSGRSRVSREQGHLEYRRAPVEALLEDLAGRHPFEVVEGLDPLARFSGSVTWEAGDAQDLAAALARDLDLHLVQERRDVQIALVEGTLDGSGG